MKAVGYQKSLPIEAADSLVDFEIAKPEPKGRDIRVAVKAISANPVDYKVRKRAAPTDGGTKILGFDAAGVVEAVGPDVSLFKPGDEVFYAGSILRQGTNSEFHLVDERIVGNKPASLSFAQAAALPLPVARILAARGVAPEAAGGYLEPKLRDLLPDPLSLRDMGVAAERLVEAAAGGERIAVFADYDVDGGASAALILAWLRAQGRPAEVLDGGFAAWRDAGLPLVDPARLPPRDRQGRTVWVTRARPKIDRIACPWLIRRFVDPRAVILFVAPSEVEGVAERHDAAPFDIEGVFFSHRGDLCSFDVMLAEFGLSVPALDRLAVIVRGADTARLDLAPEAAGLLAVSLGLSRIHADDLDQLQAGMLVYDAFYRWARDATDETHNWPTNKPGAA